MQAKARAIVSTQVAKGNIVKTPCGECGAREVFALIVEPGQPLDVVWLCKKHHRRAINKLRCGTYA